MAKYLLVFKNDEGRSCATFYDDYTSARNAAMDCECGMGWYWELYERTEEDGIEVYTFIEG